MKFNKKISPRIAQILIIFTAAGIAFFILSYLTNSISSSPNIYTSDKLLSDDTIQSSKISASTYSLSMQNSPFGILDCTSQNSIDEILACNPDLIIVQPTLSPLTKIQNLVTKLQSNQEVPPTEVARALFKCLYEYKLNAVRIRNGKDCSLDDINNFESMAENFYSRNLTLRGGANNFSDWLTIRALVEYDLIKIIKLENNTSSNASTYSAKYPQRERHINYLINKNDLTESEISTLNDYFSDEQVSEAHRASIAAKTGVHLEVVAPDLSVSH
jgi:hypothetical protein